MSDQWKYAVASWCKSKGHKPRMETISHCRWHSMRGAAGPRPGHSECEPILSAEGIGAFLGVADHTEGET